MIQYIISGGQTGADQAGLQVALDHSIKTGGWSAHGWLTKDGPNQELLQGRYNLKEHTGGYKQRTHENAKVSDGTIRCCVDFFSPGEICTLNGIKKFKKPHFDIYLPQPASHKDLLIWLLRYNIKVLNVAGNTQGTKGFDIYTMTYNYLDQFLIYLRRIRG
jgi:hypothetical protein